MPQQYSTAQNRRQFYFSRSIKYLQRRWRFCEIGVNATNTVCFLELGKVKESNIPAPLLFFDFHLALFIYTQAHRETDILESVAVENSPPGTKTHVKVLSAAHP